MYEDALENAEEALKIQSDHRKSLYRKAIGLMFLFEFEQSFALFKQLDEKACLEKLQCLQEQTQGDYGRFINNQKSENFHANYINPNLEIQITHEKGRGVFATKPIKKGQMIFAERPIAIGIETDEH